MINTTYYPFFTTLALFLQLIGNALCASEQWAVVKVPVTDVSGKELVLSENTPYYAYYNAFPYSPDKGTDSCCRVHQLKFNELVKVHTCTDTEVECELANICCIGRNETAIKTFWALKEDFLFLDSIAPSEQLHIPSSYKIGQNPAISNHNVLTLTQPWLDKETGRIYSAGTRFVRDSLQDTMDYYSISMISNDGKSSCLKRVPRSVALIKYPTDPSQAVDLFVSILKTWTQQTDGVLPYVFGGCSHTGKRSTKSFSLISGSENVTFWQRKPVPLGALSGVDCSNLVLCVAQICGIPYFYKNTTTLTAYMKPLKKGKAVKKGDLIWFPGHVMIISDLDENKLIEASGYGAGYGDVHEITVDKVFKDIHNFSELTTAYNKEQSLELLNVQGKAVRSIPPIKLFPLKKLWKHAIVSK